MSVPLVVFQLLSLATEHMPVDGQQSVSLDASVLLVCAMLRLILLLVAHSHCRQMKIESAIFSQAHILKIPECQINKN